MSKKTSKSLTGGQVHSKETPLFWADKVKATQRELANAIASGDIRQSYLLRCRLFSIYSLERNHEGCLGLLEYLYTAEVEPVDDCSRLVADWLITRLNEPEKAMQFLVRAYTVNANEPNSRTRNEELQKINDVELFLLSTSSPASSRVNELLEALIESSARRIHYHGLLIDALSNLVDIGIINAEHTLILQLIWSELSRMGKFEGINVRSSQKRILSLINRLEAPE